MNVQVKLTSSLRPSLWSNMDDLIKSTKLPLSSAPYSIAPSALANGLWSSIRSSLSFLLFITILSIWKKRGHLWVISWAAFIYCLDTWLKQIGFVSGRGCRFVFRALFILYIPHFLPHFLLFHHCWSSERESLSFRELRLRHLANFVALITIHLLRLSPLKEPSTW